MLPQAVSLIILVSVSSSYSNIQWNPGNWAHSCDWMGATLVGTVPQEGDGSKCGKECADNWSNCTHFLWFHNKCYLKFLYINECKSRETAYKNNETNSVCGFQKHRLPDWGNT